MTCSSWHIVGTYGAAVVVERKLAGHIGPHLRRLVDAALDAALGASLDANLDASLDAS